MPCPWYRGGICTSPSLDTPSADVTLLSRCLSSVEYATCKFYKNADQLRVQYETASREYGKPILIIHALNKPVRSECRFYRLLGHESGSHLAACDILKRYLNVYEVNLCASYWSECPFRRLGEAL